MATPSNAPYKKLQREAKKNRDKVLWVSRHLINIGTVAIPKWVWQRAQGTYVKALHGPLT